MDTNEKENSEWTSVNINKHSYIIHINFKNTEKKIY